MCQAAGIAVLRLLRLCEDGMAYSVADDTADELRALQAECYHAGVRLLG